MYNRLTPFPLTRRNVFSSFTHSRIASLSSQWIIWDVFQIAQRLNLPFMFYLQLIFFPLSFILLFLAKIFVQYLSRPGNLNMAANRFLQAGN